MEKILEDGILRTIAQELTKSIKKSIDLSLREPARAKMRLPVRSLLKQYGLSAKSTKEGC